MDDDIITAWAFVILVGGTILYGLYRLLRALSLLSKAALHRKHVSDFRNPFSFGMGFQDRWPSLGEELAKRNALDSSNYHPVHQRQAEEAIAEVTKVFGWILGILGVISLFVFLHSL